ncbi:MAG: InlB B-repeat-containing protein [Chitinophagaceae bacterium]|nr:InlB B-repeat-containing protein [Chitinophagaceae bacterium]
MLKKLLAFLLMVTTTLVGVSQDQCIPVGWATQNGGTTGGGAAVPVTVTTLAALQTQASSSGAKVIYVSGNMGAGVSTRVSVAANKTIIGLPGAKLIGGFDVKANNIIIRNMKIQGPGSVDVNGVDCITIDGASNVWIDHCDISDGQDGNMDIANGANYIAVTWCKFSYSSASTNHQFCNLLGNSDSKTSDRGKLKITMMYNWWTSGCKERMPRVRFGQVHVVNNYFNCTGNSHCVRAGKEADLLVESNYFDGVRTPIDLYQNNFTAVTSRNNTYVSTTGNTAGSGTAFTPPYVLTIAASGNVKSLVSNATCGAGATMTSPTGCGCGAVPATYTLTTTAAPATGGSVSGSGTYNSGTVVTLTAAPAAGYTFTGWSGDAAGTATSTTVTMNGNKTITANFQPTASSYTLSTASNPSTGGAVTGAGSYPSGTIVSVTATPAAGYTFTGWSGDASGINASTTVTMNSNKTVTANFSAIVSNYSLTTAASPAAGGTITGAGSYISGTIVTVTASPAVGYTFSNWSGDASGTSTATTVTMSSNKMVTANFLATGGGASTIRIEDNATPSTGLCLFEGAISSNSGASNVKVINLTNSIGKGVNWRVNVPAAGTLHTQLEIRKQQYQ